MVDVVRADGSLNSVFTYLSFLLAGLFIQRLVGWIDPWLSGRFQQTAGRELTRLVIVKAPRLSLEQFENTGYYDELTRAMSQTEQKGPDILDQVMNVVRNLSSLIGYGAVLWVIHPFILMGVVGLTGVSIWIAMKGGQDVWSVLSRQTFKRRLADYYGAILIDRNTAKEARLYDLKQYLIDKWTKLYWTSRNELRREAIRVDLKQFGTYGIAVLASIGALYYIAVSPSVYASPGLYTIFTELLNGWDGYLGRKFGDRDLSGGQWQKVALGRAYLKDADLVVLDEPTSALDPKSELALFERFVDLTENRTALMISHRLGAARLADHVIVMAGGQIVESGSHEELLNLNGEYARLFSAQAQWYQ